MVLRPECVPDPFADLTVAGTDPEEPFGGLRVRARFGYLAELLARRGSRVHLAVGEPFPSGYFQTTITVAPRSR